MVWRVLTKESLEQTKVRFAGSGYVTQWYAMAMEVVLTTLGQEWWSKNCAADAVGPDEFLAVPNDSEEHDRLNHQDRVIKLGHMLYGLRGATGYHAFIRPLISRDLAPAFFELWAANILAKSGYEVGFVEATGVKGGDYDLVACKGRIRLNVEAKSRRAGIVLNAQTVRNTMEKARKQLPASGPGIVMMSIPQQWTMDTAAEAVMNNVFSSHFRNSRRVNYVILVWHQWIPFNKGNASVSFVRQYQNPNPRTPIELGKIVATMDMPIELDPERQKFKPSFW